jgi:DNA-binding NarL/FixJ family response regulator
VGPPVRVLLVDDAVEVVTALAEALGGFERIEIVGICHNGVEAVRLALLLEPDVVVMDLQMPEMDGIEATRILSERIPAASVIALSVSDEASLVRRAFEAGAVRYELKGSPVRQIADAIVDVAGQRPSGPQLED